MEIMHSAINNIQNKNLFIPQKKERKKRRRKSHTGLEELKGEKMLRLFVWTIIPLLPLNRLAIPWCFPTYGIHIC